MMYLTLSFVAGFALACILKDGAMPHPLCLLSGIRSTLKTGVWMNGATVNGCSLVEDERLNQCVVTNLRCERCGKFSTGWERTARSTREPYPDEVRVAQ